MDQITSQMPLLVFLVIGTIAVASSILVVAMRNPVHSALFLLLTFLCVAVLFVIKSAEFVAAVQVLVYAGGIMVLFLFVIMLLGAEAIPGRPHWRKLIFPVSLAVILAIEAFYLLVTKARPAGDILPPEAAANTTENLRQMGMVLFSDYLLPFEVTSILLLVAMVGAIVLSKKEKGAQK